LPVAEKSDLNNRHITRWIKRLSDIVFSIAALVFYGPLMLLCAIAIRLESPGPIIFRQKRVGWHGKTFTIFKLRTMKQGSEREPQWAQVADPRVTRIGRLLRLTHIDELPQLFNILRGEMSFVGPRPERPEFVEQLNKQIPYYDVRHILLPGITGWAQVNFRYGASVADARRKLEFDLYYVVHASLILDLLIVLKTIQVVLFMRGSR
jgi:exopolysaccharide biosynthesis polyprenyl glycosylphosphotransferase